MITNTPAYSLQGITFFTLAGVESAQLDGEEILGCFANSLKDFYGSKGKWLFEDFVNWPNTPVDVLRFTRLYGPLETSAGPGVEFRFRLANWHFWQETLRAAWGAGTSFLGIYDDRPGGRGWKYDGKHLSYRAANLWEYLHISLMACPKERLRKCTRPDCPHPYFVARHLKQHYCSERCAAWGQRQWKLKWWKKYGKDWREKHKRTPKRS